MQKQIWKKKRKRINNVIARNEMTKQSRNIEEILRSLVLAQDDKKSLEILLFLSNRIYGTNKTANSNHTWPC